MRLRAWGNSCSLTVRDSLSTLLRPVCQSSLRTLASVFTQGRGDPKFLPQADQMALMFLEGLGFRS